jgi:hypothetical protein
MISIELTSVRSPRVVAAKRLAKRAFRARERRFLAEGPQAVREAVAAGRDIVHEVFVTREAATRHAEMVDDATRQGVDVYVVSGEVMSALSQTVTPQGIVAVCAFLDGSVEEVAAVASRQSSGRELAGALRLLAGWGARTSESPSAPRHSVCGTPMEARWWCPSCERPVGEDEGEELLFA